MTRCEVCRAPVTHVCGGLDVPMLGFCAEHAEDHRRVCVELREETAQLVECGVEE